MFKRSVVRRQGKVSKSENFEVRNRNAFLPSLCSRKRNSKSTGQLSRYTKRFRNEKFTSCKKFSKTMDECKRYLKELHDSNKNLGLVGSSSEVSDDSSMKNVWSKTKVNTNEIVERTVTDNLFDCITGYVYPTKGSNW